MATTSYKFGPFFVDRTRYCVLRGDRTIDLTPKLLDLLLHLLDNAGSLVTKEQLLDALWPDANVTDNALAQAISELRDALGDEPGDPQFIKTIARRGYRFIAPLERIEPAAVVKQKSPATVPGESDPSIAVMDFVNVAGDRESAWLSAGIAETVTGDLRSLGRFRVVDRGRVMDAIGRTDGSIHAVSQHLGTKLAVVGSYQRSADRIRITSRVVDVQTGEALADAKVDGPIGDIFTLQDDVVRQFSEELGLTGHERTRTRGLRETASLEAYRAYTEAWLRLETLDLREIPSAIAGFERAIAIDPKYALAVTGLASAELAAYEATRWHNAPSTQLLQAAIAHSREAIALDETLAEAHATLAHALLKTDSPEATQIARHAVALEPASWRHVFRLCYASWGDERLRAANRTLALYPDFAYVHFQTAMVHVARGHLREAETVIRQGAAVQDRQVARGDRYPALGLHWLLGLVRLAQGDVDEALEELAREEARAQPHRLYGPEYEITAIEARAACLLRTNRIDEAIECFERALGRYGDHAQSLIGLASALRAKGLNERASRVVEKLPAIVKTLKTSRPTEAVMVQSQILAMNGQLDESANMLASYLESAPPGFAGWSIPIEPFFLQLKENKVFQQALQALADRAR